LSGRRSDGVSCRQDRTYPSARGARAHNDPLGQCGARDGCDAWHTHSRKHIWRTHTQHTHTHIHIHIYTRDTNTSARSATHARQRLLFHVWRRLRVATVIWGSVVIIRPFVWCDCLVSISYIAFLCIFRLLYYLHVAVAHIILLTVNTACGVRACISYGSQYYFIIIVSKSAARRN